MTYSGAIKLKPQLKVLIQDEVGDNFDEFGPSGSSDDWSVASGLQIPFPKVDYSPAV